MLYKLSLNKYYVDEIYDFLIVKPALFLSRNVILNFFDIAVIERIVNGIPKLIGQLSGSMRKMQDGLVSHYLAYMCGGTVFIIIWMVVRA